MKTLGIDLQKLEAEMARAVIFEIAISIIILIVLFWATYWVIKAGVRDGIREANPWHRSQVQTSQPRAPDGYRWALVKETAHTEDMRAD